MGMHGGVEKWLEILKEKDHSIDLSVDGTINIKVELWEIRLDTVDWFYLTQDRDRLRALVNTVMNLRVP
jgi:hypothetical protein